MSYNVETMLDQLVSRSAITEVLHRYARLIDEQDFDAVAALFTADCVAHYGAREGDTLTSPSEVIDWIRTQLRGVRATSHHISNVEIDFIDSDHAHLVFRAAAKRSCYVARSGFVGVC